MARGTNYTFAELMELNRPARDKAGNNPAGGKIGGSYALKKDKVSAACKKGKHGQCFMLGCACQNCTHGASKERKNAK